MEKPEVKNNRYGVPTEHYLDLYRKLDPEKRAEELGLSYQDQKFSITMYSDNYEVSWPEGEVTSENANAIGVWNDEAKIMLYRYLISGIVLPETGNYKTFPQLPGGAIYTQTFNGRCIARAAWKFGTNVAGLKKAAEALNGTDLAKADAGFEFAFIGNYKVQILVWEGDDEFPPNSQFLYTDNFAAGFSAEDGVVAAELLITALSGRMK